MAVKADVVQGLLEAEGESEGGELPFTPFSAPLRDVLRTKYIRNAAIWLMGKEDNSILAQAGNSVWEAALTVRFLADVSEIFAESGEEAELSERIRYKSAVVSRWLLSKRTGDCWENVTWDTSVTVRALMIALKKYSDSFSDHERREILEAIRKGIGWLCHRFSQWETQVKYPFGPADVSQIVIALIHLTVDHPELYQAVCNDYYGVEGPTDLAAEIVQYLLHKKTEKTLTIETTAGAEEVIAYWWDDYFSTAEVVEALAWFHQYCESSDARRQEHKQLLHSVKVALVRACTYFEQEQVEGMWGSHIDTVKVIYSYVIIRRLVPQRAAAVDAPLIVPEVHTTFKALRWMCDEKQIFSDGSFLHTMFLTIFYALALVEIYRSWEPAHDAIAKIYDDVVWFSPVRTTPERSRRLAAEISNTELNDQLEARERQLAHLALQLNRARQSRVKIAWTGVVGVLGIPLLFIVGVMLNVIHLKFAIDNASDFLEYLGVFVAILVAAMAAIWQYDRFLGEHQQ